MEWFWQGVAAGMGPIATPSISNRRSWPGDIRGYRRCARHPPLLQISDIDRSHIPRIKIIGQQFDLLNIEGRHDPAILPCFSKWPYIGIKSRPELSRQRAYSELMSRQYGISGIPICSHYPKPRRDYADHVTTMAGRCADMRHGPT
jgi:hypothetical protein